LVYQPYKELDGTITGVLVLCQEVTQQVMARRALEQQERAMSNAIELAELGTWTLDVASGHTRLSARHATMFGLDSPEMPYETALSVVHPQDRDRVGAAFAQALQPNSDGRYQAEYRILNARTGQQQVIRARGELTVDEAGKRQMTGVAQDVTLERALQATLEQQVQRQTEEIAAANEELLALNEELTRQNETLALLNEEMAEANQLLLRSNENLQTFAYVASHDLQEPLRKIQQFGDLLKTRYGDSAGDTLVYLERMQTAARRMSTLIKDLLDYSRLSTQRVPTRWVSLQEVVGQVLSTLELTLQETGAQVSLEPLPTVMGDASQLNQLVQNLLSNALKFRRPGVTPHIVIKASRVSADHLPEGLTLSRNASGYHRIDMVDNGIGFEEKYLDRIFQVF
ncbi:sensor histidine kinase, partial [Spirosoma aerophilum]